MPELLLDRNSWCCRGRDLITFAADWPAATPDIQTTSNIQDQKSTGLTERGAGKGSRKC